jgi:hypothetical protein
MASVPNPDGRFHVPLDGHLYYEDIVDRCHGFINCGIWEGLDRNLLRAWLTNFRSDEERYFAACVLDALIFRSEKQTISLFRHLFLRVIPDLARLEPGHSGALVDVHQKLKRTEFPVEPGIRLVSATKSSDPPSKSSPTLLRHLKRHLQIDERWIIDPAGIPACFSRGVGVFVFIDDLLGTGDQFKQLVDGENLLPVITSSYVAYCPLAAHKKGIAALNSAVPLLKIRSVELLDERNEIFDPSAGCFDDGINDAGAAESFYYELLESRGIPLASCDRRGYGGLELAYAFQHAVPDNNLPILWWDKSPDWKPLFVR